MELGHFEKELYRRGIGLSIMMGIAGILCLVFGMIYVKDRIGFMIMYSTVTVFLLFNMFAKRIRRK